MLEGEDLDVMIISLLMTNPIELILGRDLNQSPGTPGQAAMEVIEATGRSAEAGQNWAIR